MKYLFYIVIFILVVHEQVQSQIRIAYVDSLYSRFGELKDETATRKNLALINSALIELKGDNWYEENILKKACGDIEQKRKLHTVFRLFCDGSIKITPPYNDSIITDALNLLPDYFRNNKSLMYIYDMHYIKLIRTRKVDAITMKFELPNIIKKRASEISDKSLLTYYYPWIPLLSAYGNASYSIYCKEEKRKGVIPLSRMEWTKMKIKQDLAEPIKSSLDYGITNEDLLIVE